MSLNSGSALRLIELGRWAPSGDNTQPWRFEIVSDDHMLIHGHDTRDHCVYDLDGHPSQLAMGALIETLHIAATEQALRLHIARRPDSAETHPVFDVRMTEDPAVAPDPLLPCIPRRSVCRKPMSTRALTGQEVSALENALPAGYTLRWYASLLDRWRMARLMFANAKLRLTMREAYEVHRSVIDWGQRFSADKVPDQALGVDAMTLRIMRWAMADWGRVRFMNRWAFGTLAPRLQMDLAPSLLCAAHFALIAERQPFSIDDYIKAGQVVQRLWLTASKLGLQHQPELTPLIFSRYICEGIRFSRETNALPTATSLARAVGLMFGPDLMRVCWIGRIGQADPALTRSIRRSVQDLAGR